MAALAVHDTEVAAPYAGLSCASTHFVRHAFRSAEIEPATAVDHRTPIKRGGEPFSHLDELASLCEGCHNAKTRAEQMGEDWLRKGCDIFGYPLDPNHPWYRGGK